MCITFSASTVPEKNPVFRVTDAQKHTVSLAWAPPVEPNGILTGYLLEYQLSTYPYISSLHRTNSDVIVMHPSRQKEILLFPLGLFVFTSLYFFPASTLETTLQYIEKHTGHIFQFGNTDCISEDTVMAKRFKQGPTGCDQRGAPMHHHQSGFGPEADRKLMERIEVVMNKKGQHCPNGLFAYI